jgi:hypothetical protein
VGGGRGRRGGEVVYKGKVCCEREMDREKTRGTTLLKFSVLKSCTMLPLI